MRGLDQLGFTPQMGIGSPERKLDEQNWSSVSKEVGDLSEVSNQQYCFPSACLAQKNPTLWAIKTE